MLNTILLVVVIVMFGWLLYKYYQPGYIYSASVVDDDSDVVSKVKVYCRKQGWTRLIKVATNRHKQFGITWGDVLGLYRINKDWLIGNGDLVVLKSDYYGVVIRKVVRKENDIYELEYPSWLAPDDKTFNTKCLVTRRDLAYYVKKVKTLNYRE